METPFEAPMANGDGVQDQDDRGRVCQGGVGPLPQQVADPETVHKVVGHIEKQGCHEWQRMAARHFFVSPLIKSGFRFIFHSFLMSEYHSLVFYKKTAEAVLFVFKPENV